MHIYPDIDRRVSQKAAEAKARGESFDPISHADARDLAFCVTRKLVGDMGLTLDQRRERERTAVRSVQAIDAVHAKKLTPADDLTPEQQTLEAHKALTLLTVENQRLSAEKLILVGSLDRALARIRELELAAMPPVIVAEPVEPKQWRPRWYVSVLAGLSVIAFFVMVVR